MTMPKVLGGLRGVLGGWAFPSGRGTPVAVFDHVHEGNVLYLGQAVHVSLRTLEIDILLPNNQIQHRTVHIQKDVLPYALC